MKKFLSTLVVASSLIAASQAYSQSQTESNQPSAKTASDTKSTATLTNPQVFTQNAVDEVINVLRKNKDITKTDPKQVTNTVETVLEPNLGTDTMCQFVAGKLYESASIAEKKKFEKQFLTFIVNTFSTALKNYDKQTVKVYPMRGDAWKTQNTVAVPGIIQNPDNPSADVNIIFVLAKNTDQNADQPVWRIVDLNVEGIRAMGNIQPQIKSLIQQGYNTLPKLTDFLQNKNNGK